MQKDGGIVSTNPSVLTTGRSAKPGPAWEAASEPNKAPTLDEGDNDTSAHTEEHKYAGRSLPSGSQGNMWSADQFRRYFRDRFQVRIVYSLVFDAHDHL